MNRRENRSKFIIIIIAIVWFFLFGLRLVDYFSVINEKGLREAVCGTQGCSDTIFFFSSAWNFLIFISPLIIPLVLVIYWSFKKRVTKLMGISLKKIGKPL